MVRQSLLTGQTALILSLGIRQVRNDIVSAYLAFGPLRLLMHACRVSRMSHITKPASTSLNLCVSPSAGSDVLPERTLRRGSLRHHSKRTHVI
jgi:hypothetical protein